MRKLILFSLLLLFFNITAKAQDQDAIRKKITDAYLVITAGEFDKFSDYITEDFVEHSPSPGQKQGLAGLQEMFRMMRKAYPDMKLSINDIIIDPTGIKAAVLITFTGTNTGDMMGMPATNKKVNVQGIDWLTLNNDMKATEHWGYMDTDALMQQLGMGMQK